MLPHSYVPKTSGSTGRLPDSGKQTRSSHGILRFPENPRGAFIKRMVMRAWLAAVLIPGTSIAVPSALESTALTTPLHEMEPAPSPAAGTISCGQTVTGSITSVGQKDSYTFPAVAGDKVIISSASNSYHLDTIAELYDPSGNLLGRAPPTGKAGFSPSRLPGLYNPGQRQ